MGQRNPKIFFYEADGLGSVTSLTDPTGAVAATYNYDSFGFLTSSTGSATNWFRYTARQFDSESALYYYRARYYDPTSGRFLSEDPIRFSGGTTNFYQYVANRPVTASDPFGLCPNKNGLSKNCLNALKQAGADAQGLQRALDAWSSLRAISLPQGLDPAILASIGIVETDFRNITGDKGHGHGVFQIDDRAHPQEAATIAYDPDLAASFAANLLVRGYLRNSENGVSPSVAMAAAIREYNGTGGIPTSTVLSKGLSLDTGTTNGNYVSRVLGLYFNCF